MTLKEKLELAWKNRGVIVEGFYHAYVSSTREQRDVALERLEICRSNKCGLYNPKGENTDTLKAVFAGKESCGGCGCGLWEKCNAMSAQCFLGDINPDTQQPYSVPLWEAIITPEQESEFIRIAQEKQQNNFQQPTNNQ